MYNKKVDMFLKCIGNYRQCFKDVLIQLNLINFSTINHHVNVTKYFTFYFDYYHNYFLSFDWLHSGLILHYDL